MFDLWWGGGHEADLWWTRYEKIRGRSYKEALYDTYASHIWEYDKHHLDTSDLGLMVHPVGRSAHIELGYLVGQGKPTYIYFDRDPLVDDRWDVMPRFVNDVFFDMDELTTAMKEVYDQW